MTSRWSYVAVAGLFAVLCTASGLSAGSRPASAKGERSHWIGTWAAAPQAAVPGRVLTLRNQTVRLIVHTSIGGSTVRIRISNIFGDRPLFIGAAHVARRATGADIDARTDRTLMFHGHASTTLSAGSTVVSDAVKVDAPALSDLAISLFLPKSTAATTLHILALQTNYVSPEMGDATGAVRFPVGKTILSWPFLTGVDVSAAQGAAIVAFGSSTTDGDGSTRDTNHRWPDLLAERLQRAGNGEGQLGVLNEGIIGNRLLKDSHSSGQAGGPFEAVLRGFGDALGSAGMARYERDVLEQSGVRYVIINLGVNDVLFPGSFTPERDRVSAEDLIRGYRELNKRAHSKGVRVIGTTIPPFEHATFRGPVIHFYTPEKEATRERFNKWILSSREFDGVIDLDRAVRDPNRPTQILPAYDSGDHLHVNDAGNAAQANAIDLALFRRR